MKEETLKKLGFCQAYEYLFGTDEYHVMSAITEDAGEYSEWQEFKKENELKIEAYKNKFIEMHHQTKL